jgi:hypothetical protein
MKQYKSDTQLPIEFERTKKIKIELATFLLEHTKKAMEAVTRVCAAKISGHKESLQEAADDAALAIAALFSMCRAMKEMEVPLKQAMGLIEMSKNLTDCHDKECTEDHFE